MDWSQLSQQSVLITATLATVLVCGIAWRRRRAHGGMWLFLLVLAVAVWCLANVLEGLAEAFSAALFWAQVQVIGKVSSPVFFFLYALSFARRPNIPRWFMRLLGVVPIFILGLAFSNPFHGLLWRSVTLSAEASHLSFEAGPLEWIGTAHAYLLIGAAGIILINAALTLRHIYRRQAIILLLAMAPPWILNIVTMSTTRSAGVDLTPFGFALSAVMLVYAMRHHQMADLVPMARGLVLDVMEDGMIVVDGKGRVADLNRTSMQIFALGGADPAVGCCLDALPGPPEIWHALQSGSQSHAEITLPGPAGARVYDIKATPLPGTAGEAAGLLLALRDITQRVQAQSALETANTLLQAEVVANKRLIADLDAFGHTVAHDLKSPLGQMAGAADLLVNDDVTLDPATRREMTALIRDSAFKAAEIVDELLLLASTRSQDIDLQPLEMAAVIESVRQRLQPDLEATGTILKLPDTWPAALGNPIWVEEVWWNLLSNGIKYGGSPPILRLGSAVREGEIRFWVCDNGDGIAPERLPEIFTPLGNGNGTGNSHGFGLSIASNIIEKMGGSVAAESPFRPGAGCTFSFTLPRAGRLPDAPALFQPPTPAQPG